MGGATVYFLAVEGFADWEAAHALAELRRHGGFDVRVIGFGRRAVLSMAGITVQPTHDLGDVDLGDMAMLIMPGGDRWEQEPLEADLIDVLKEVDGASIAVAAICAATTAIVRAGIIRGRRHTSNGLEYLKSHVPTYGDFSLYSDAPAVRDRHLITASGLADVEFAREIMAELGVLTERDRAYWTTLFRGGVMQPRE